MNDADAWAGERVARWIRQSEALERQMAPVSTQLFAAVALRPGERVLDIGCGTGPTTREAALRVGPAGRVTGLDVAAEMVEAAAAPSAAAGSAPIDWLVADAGRWDPQPGTYDAVISRFGVMFFDHPVAAARRLATATTAGGRLAVAVWGRRDASPLFDVPYRVAIEVCTAAGHPVDELPADAGAFSWHDDTFVTSLLTSAGWRDVCVAEHVLALSFAGGLNPQAAADTALDFGPTRLVVAGAEPAVIETARAAIREALAGHVDSAGGVVLDATVRIITAQK